MMQVEIRNANSDDVQILQELNDEIFIDNASYDPDLRLDWARSQYGKKYFTELVADHESICLIAEIEGKAVGYIAAAPKEVAYRNSRYIEIENMGVTPSVRSLGIGSRLMQECLTEAKKRGFQKVYVNSYSENEAAIGFYKRNGFAVIDVSLEKTL